MELNDIIKQDDDRLFIVDPECFIIFTGDSIQDEKPFIRIGSWLNLPIKSISLIENIIIPDLIIGNPAYEQFNINTGNISKNRYVGSKFILKKYLDFQKLFELDLNKAPIIDVEKDLPSLPKEKIISDRESFIGIFYTNGNFTVVRSGNKIFDLKEIEGKSITDNKIHNQLSLKNKNVNRYSESGLVLINDSPFFYKNKFFTSYLFPQDYYEEFSRLNIDPARIREVLFPSSNFFNVIKMVKWKDSQRNRLKIFSDSREKVNLMQRLFSSATIIGNNFDGLSYDTGDGLNIKNYPGTLNLKITYKKIKTSYEDITIAYIKNYSGIPDIIKDCLDAIFIPYTIFEDINMLLKSTDTPYAIVSDGNKNISKLRGTGSIVIHSDLQYEFQKYSESDILLKKALGLISNRNAEPYLAEMDMICIQDIILHGLESKEELCLDEMKDLFNIGSILRIHLHSTTDRKFVLMIKKALEKLNSINNWNTVFANNKNNLKIILAFHNKSIYEFIEEINEEKTDAYKPFLKEIEKDTFTYPGGFDNDELRDFYERMTNDRKRFNELLNIYLNNANSKKNMRKKNNSELSGLNNSFDKKKEILFADDIEINSDELKRTLLGMRLKKISRALTVLIIFSVFVFVSYMSYNYYQEYKERKRIEARIAEENRIKEAENKKIEDIIKKYAIHISEKDIYLYADKVAVKNGYDRLDYGTLKKKNPDWIFPGNIFILLDGEKILVSKGDTLWGISDEKLMQISIEFYKTIDIIKEDIRIGKNVSGNFIRAKKLAFSKKHYNLINDLENRSSIDFFDPFAK